MKRIISLVAILGFLISLSPLSLAGWNWNKSGGKSSATFSEEAKKQASLNAALETRQRSEAKAKAALTAKDWTIYVKAISEVDAKPSADVLVFSPTQVTSKDLYNKGYPASDYTINFKDDGTILWEAIQISSKRDMAFLRGELRGEVMVGILSLKSSSGDITDFYFTNTASNDN